jgi:hypothetical protein
MVQAQTARDQLAAQVGRSRATVVGGYNVETGEVGAATSGGGLCAEANLCAQLGGNASSIRFTQAVRYRPDGNIPVPVCLRCQLAYSPDQFEYGTQFQPGVWVPPTELLEVNSR